MDALHGTERVETAIIGGGQAGLATAYYLKERGRPFVILDAGDRIGDAWRTRWDSLRLFTPARFDSLPGFPFPGPNWSFPTKDEMAEYLEAYVERFGLPVRTGVKVESAREGRRSLRDHLLSWPFRGRERRRGDGLLPAPQGSAGFADQLRPDITQLHSKDYLSPSRLAPGDVLVVGVGNSGADISMELSATRHPTLLAGKESGHIPARHGSLISRPGFRVFRFILHRVLTRGNPIGRKLAPKLFGHGDPLVRVRPKDLAAAGIERVPRVAGVQDGLPLLEDGRVLDVANVIWCTGYRSRLRMDRPADPGRRWRAHPRPRRRRVPTGPVLHRARVPVLTLVRRPPRHVPGSRLRREPPRLPGSVDLRGNG